MRPTRLSESLKKDFIPHGDAVRTVMLEPELDLYTDQVLFALIPSREMAPMSPKDIGRFCDIGLAQAERILGALYERSRVSRTESTGPSGKSCFVYWLSAAQRRVAVGLGEVEAIEQAAPPQPVGDTGRSDAKVIEQEKKRLEALNKKTRQQINILKAGVRAFTAQQQRLAKERARLAATYAELQDSLAIHENALATLINMQKGPMSASEKLAFLRSLRKRPALEHLAALAEIEADYERVLAVLRGRD